LTCEKIGSVAYVELIFTDFSYINNTFIREPVAALALTTVLAVKSATAAQLVTGWTDHLSD